MFPFEAQALLGLPLNTSLHKINSETHGSRAPNRNRSSYAEKRANMPRNMRNAILHPPLDSVTVKRGSIPNERLISFDAIDVRTREIRSKPGRYFCTIPTWKNELYCGCFFTERLRSFLNRTKRTFSTRTRPTLCRERSRTSAPAKPDEAQWPLMATIFVRVCCCATANTDAGRRSEQSEMFWKQNCLVVGRSVHYAGRSSRLKTSENRNGHGPRRKVNGEQRR